MRPGATGQAKFKPLKAVLPIAVVVLAAISCLAIKQDSGADRATAQDVEAGQMAGTISSPGSSGQSPGSASGTIS